MPLPFSNVVQRRHLSESKRVRSIHIPLSPFDGDSPISLFDLLPVELQIEIFTRCLPPLAHFDAREAPLLVASVSQGWRALVLSVPKLWSSFEVTVSAPLHDLYVERTTRLWLSRSKNHPLTMSIVDISVGQMLGVLSARLLNLIIPEAHRWRSVQLVVPTANMVSLPSHFPLLESFGLHLMGSWKSAPAVNISTAHLPWGQLSRLDLQLETNNLPTLGVAMSILSQTPRLRMFKISVDCTLGNEVDLDDLHLPVLEEFHLILQGGNVFPFTPDSPASSLTEFLYHISMPTLRVLSITWLVQRPTLWPNRDLFVSFLRRTCSTLKSLDLAYLPVSETDLVEILVLFTNVTHLHLRFSLSDQDHDPISDNLLSLLSLRNSLSDDFHPLLPRIMSLDLHCSGSHFSNSTLLAMVKSRWKYGAGLGDGFVHFGILSMKPRLREMERQVEAMRCEGLDIAVQTLLVR